MVYYNVPKLSVSSMSLSSKFLNPGVVLGTPELAVGVRSEGGFVDFSLTLHYYLFLAKEGLIFI